MKQIIAALLIMLGACAPASAQSEDDDINTQMEERLKARCDGVSNILTSQDVDLLRLTTEEGILGSLTSECLERGLKTTIILSGSLGNTIAAPALHDAIRLMPSEKRKLLTVRLTGSVSLPILVVALAFEPEQREITEHSMVVFTPVFHVEDSIIDATPILDLNATGKLEHVYATIIAERSKLELTSVMQYMQSSMIIDAAATKKAGIVTRVLESE